MVLALPPGPYCSRPGLVTNCVQVAAQRGRVLPCVYWHTPTSATRASCFALVPRRYACANNHHSNLDTALCATPDRPVHAVHAAVAVLLPPTWWKWRADTLSRHTSSR
jgi:hypothetical protein